MKINGRDVTLTDEELNLLERLKANGVISITKSDENVIMWHDGDFSLQGSTINVRWFKGFDWMENGETMYVQMLLDMSKKTKTVWDLKDGDTYYFVDVYGDVWDSAWHDERIQTHRRSQGNMFLTKEEAEFEAKRREVVTKVRKYTRPFKSNEFNWCPYWRSEGNSIQYYVFETCMCNMDYFDSKELIRKAIDEVGEDDFKKYYLGVVEDE